MPKKEYWGALARFRDRELASIGRRSERASPDRGLPQRRVSPLGADLMDLRCLGSILLLQAIQQLPQVNVELVASVRSKLAERGLQIPLRHSNVCALANLR